MPYGCAIKDYSSGLCQPPSAHYKPYTRSTAVSPNAHNVSLGIYEQFGCFCLGTRVPCPWPRLLLSISPGEKGRGMQGGSGRGEQRTGRTGQFGGTGKAQGASGTKRHRKPPKDNTCQLHGSLPPETGCSQAAGSVFSGTCQFKPETVPWGHWGEWGWGRPSPGLPAPAVVQTKLGASQIRSWGGCMCG